MSIEATVWALKVAPVPDPIAHLILIGLADHAAADGTGAWPSVETLAEYARCSPRSVHRKLRALEESVVISRGEQAIVQHLRSDRRPTVWNLNLGVTQSHPVPTDGVTGQAERGDRTGTHGVTPVADKPPMNRTEPYKELLVNADASTETIDVPVIERITGKLVDLRAIQLFDAFWEMYPRKVGKETAHKAFDKATKKVPVSTILAGAQRLAADPNLPGKQFIPHPTTWINRAGWDDEPCPPKAGIDFAASSYSREGESRSMTGAEWLGKAATNV